MNWLNCEKNICFKHYQPEKPKIMTESCLVIDWHMCVKAAVNSVSCV